MTVYHAGQERATCTVQKNFKQREAVTLKRYCLSLLDLIQFSATKA